MVYIKKSGIDRQVTREKDLRRQQRREWDKITGLTKDSGAKRQDFKLCRENDKLYKDYRRFNDKSSREKIKRELEQVKKEYREYGKD